MPFMVIYRNADGSSGYEQATAIDEAALFVERLRNNESIDQIRLFRMEEINFAFRPYYKVELGLPERVEPERGGGADRRTSQDGPEARDPGGPQGGPPVNGVTGSSTNGARLGLFQR
jgi:hypothetical protein